MDYVNRKFASRIQFGKKKLKRIIKARVVTFFLFERCRNLLNGDGKLRTDLIASEYCFPKLMVKFTRISC